MKQTEKKQRWVPHQETLPQSGGPGVTRRILAYTDGLMCVENTFEQGAVGALHSHPHTQITYVVSGTFAFTIDGETRTVDVHIRTLRQKLGECGSCIETVRGSGYRIRENDQ